MNIKNLNTIHMKTILTFTLATFFMAHFTYAQYVHVQGQVGINVYGQKRHHGNHHNGTVYQGGTVYQPGTVYQGGSVYQGNGSYQGGNVYQQGNVNCQSPSNAYYLQVMNPTEFNIALQTISNQWFDSSRLVVAEQIANSHYLYAAQVEQIMELFSFDSSKLSFAKKAYYHTLDPANYYLVNNAFSFSSSARDLSYYIARQ